MKNNVLCTPVYVYVQFDTINVRDREQTTKSIEVTAHSKFPAAI